MPAWTFRRAKSLDLCGLQRAGTGQVISYPSETQKCCSIVPRDIEKAGKRFLTSYPLSVTACLPAVKLVCFQTFLIGGCQKERGVFTCDGYTGAARPALLRNASIACASCSRRASMLSFKSRSFTFIRRMVLARSFSSSFIEI